MPVRLVMVLWVSVGMLAQKPGAVTGVVVEEKSGEPVRKAAVILSREQGESVGAETDAEGAFVFRDLAAGGYTVRVERNGYLLAPDDRPPGISVTAGETTSGIRLKMVRAAAISGRVVDADGEPAVGANVRIVRSAGKKGNEAYATTNDRGEYRAFQVTPGSYTVAVTYMPRAQQMQIRMQSKAAAYPTVYYPGVPDTSQATVVQVAAGQDLQGIDLQLIRTSGVRIRGVIVTPGGMPPLFVFVSLEPGGLNQVVRDPTKGEFELSNVLPGTYRMTVTAGGLDEASRLTATRKLEVGSADIEGLEIALSPQQKVKGRVLVPEGRKVPAGLMVILGNTDSHAGGGMAQVGADGTFVTTAVPPGDYDVMIGANASTGGDLYTSSIRQGDEDALTEGAHVRDVPPAPLEIVLRAGGATLECLVKNADGTAVYGAQVRLASDRPGRSRALWGYCRTNERGTCRISGITPGAYHAYALPSDAELPTDPEALKPLEKFAQAIKLAEGERKTLDLRLVPE
jgi:hypothetical protein